MARYAYTINERDGRGTPIEIKGEIKAQSVQEATFEAMRDSFQIVTEGKGTVYGQPGSGGCTGPYTITRFLLERMES